MEPNMTPEETAQGTAEPAMRSESSTSTVGTTMESGETAGIGPVVGAGLIILLLALGGWYYFNMKADENTTLEGPTAEEIMQSADPQTESLSSQGNSDELDAIYSDTEATNLDSLDQEMVEVQSNLNQ